jgi:hypothetical protein
MAHSKSSCRCFHFLPFCNRKFLEKFQNREIPFFSREIPVALFSRENSCYTYFIEKIHVIVAAAGSPLGGLGPSKFGEYSCVECNFSAGAKSSLSRWFCAFNLRKSEFLGAVDRNVSRNSLENSRELVRNREEKLT